MKALVALLGLITAGLHSGEAAVAVKPRAYNVTGYIAPGQGNVPRGTTVLLICDVEGLTEGNVVISYTWHYSFTSTGRFEIQRGDPYYKAVNDTLLVDTSSWGGGTRWHICEVQYLSEDKRSHKQSSFILISPTDSSTPFILTPTSLLPNHTLITDVQQITGRNGQWWINCTSGSSRRGGREETGVHIHSAGSGVIVAGNRMKTATIGPGRYPRNGLYYCSEGQASRYYISLFLRNSSDLPTPIIRVLSTTAWGFSSADGSQVERYIVEFECRVRNMTFVEKYMSVSASGGTGRVGISVSCFGGLGQLYRVKVWAVSGPNISRRPAVTVINTDGPTLTTQVPTSTPTTGTTGRVITSSRWPAVTVVDTDGPTLTTQVMMSTPTTAGSTATPSRVTTTSERSYSSSSRVTPSSSAKEHERPTPTTQVMTSTTTTAGSTATPSSVTTTSERSDSSSSSVTPTSSLEQHERPTPTTQVMTSTTTTAGSTATPSSVTTLRSSNISSSTTTMNSSSSRSSVTPSSSPEQHGDKTGFGTFIGVGVGIGMLLFIVVLALAGVIVAVVMVKRRAANKKTGGMKMRNNPSYSNSVAVELEVKGLGADYEDADKDRVNASVVDGFNPYEDVDSKAQMKNTKKPAPKESSSPASAANAIYAIVDKSKKKGAMQKQEVNGCTLTNKDDLYTVPMKKSKMADGGKAASGCAEKSEDYDDVAELKYEPKVDSESRQPSEEDSKAPNVDMLYAVVDKSRKKKT